MRNVMVIARRELRGYFDSPVAYIVVVAFLALAGWMYFSSFFLIGRADMRSFFSASPFSPSMLIVILAPAITMRLVAEERKSGTIELLTTMPIRDSEVIVGKFLGALGLIASALAVTIVYAVTVGIIGDLDWGPVISGYLGFLLFSAALLSIGLLCSTLTENQIVAFILGFVACGILYFIYWLQFLLPQFLAAAVEFLSISFHLDNMARGIIDSRDVLYYLTVITAALFLAERSLGRQHA